MAKYLLLIHEDESALAGADEATYKHLYDEHMAFGAEFKDVLLGGEALTPTPTTTTVRRDGDGFVVTDGAFAEVKEALGGYYLIDVPDLDAAIACAKKVPIGPWDGHIQVRPIMVFE